MKALVVALLLAGATAVQAQAPADVAVYPLTLSDTANARLRALADSCAGVIARRLTTDTLVVLRRPAPLPVVRRTKAARYAVIGTLAQDSGKYNVELKLWDVDTDEELRSYFTGLETEACQLATVAGPRIARAVKEMLREAGNRR